MTFPKKGEIVPLNQIQELCIHFDLLDLWDKISSDPPPKPFKSDGCSCWPDVWRNKKGKKVSLYPACLKHDLQYWAGRKGEDMSRFIADVELMVDVAMITRRIKLALIIFVGVRTGGVSWLKTLFRWGFGRE